MKKSDRYFQNLPVTYSIRIAIEIALIKISDTIQRNVSLKYFIMKTVSFKTIFSKNHYVLF